MTLTLLLLAYIGNVFLNRLLNKRLIMILGKNKIEPIVALWFMSLIGTILLLSVFIFEDTKFNRWFTGKHW